MKHNYINITVVALIIATFTFEVTGQQRRQQPAEMSPEQAFVEFENTLFALRDYQMTFTVATEGAVVSELEGTVRVHDGTVISLSADGTVGRQRVSVRFNSDGTRLTGGTRADMFDEAAPENFYGYYVQGLTRLGLTDMIMRLLDGEPPVFPQTEEEEIDWAVVNYASTGERQFIGNIEAFPFGIQYSVFGEHIGEGRLWINVASGLPFRREGSMRIERGVVELVEYYGFTE
jgi:hypothetical protein